MNNSNNNLPSKDEVEISIFGPGIGECVVIHLCDEKWIIIDSCLDKESAQPIALQYLKSLGVDIKSSVELIVVTHWHDDHIKGTTKILKACETAEFVCSLALRSTEFFTLVESYSKSPLIEYSGVDEFSNILLELQQRQGTGSIRSRGPSWAKANTRLLQLSNKNCSYNVEVFALSPSDGAITLAYREIGQLIPQTNSPKRRVVAQRPNHVSVVLWISIGDIHILLGSDLEDLPDQNLGWKAVVMSQNRPQAHALVVKVPHHGSSTSYAQDMWEKMVESDATALITPFASGKKPLPTEADIKKIKKHTSQIYCTGRPAGWSPIRRDPAVERTIREVCKTHRSVYGQMGHVRLRISPNQGIDSSRIELFNGAFMA